MKYDDDIEIKLLKISRNSSASVRDGIYNILFHYAFLLVFKECSIIFQILVINLCSIMNC